MSLVIPQVLLPMLAVLGLNQIAITEDKKSLLPLFKKGLIATGITFALLFVIYMSVDYLSNGDKNLLSQVQQANQPQLSQAVDSFFDALKEDRQSLMLGDIFRSLGFIAVGILLVFLMLRNALKPLAGVAILTVFAFIDVMVINTNYLNADSYKEVEENALSFQKTKTDEQLLADTSFYRVFNVSGNAFNENITSYYYNSVGGYHAAKLLIYQDLIEHQLSKQPMNESVFDMLNTKYLIQKDQNGQTQAFQLRPSALGPVWFVKHVHYVKSADEEMKALDRFSPADTAIVQEQFKSAVSNFEYDSTAFIRLIKNDNDVVTYAYQAQKNQFAVFSEVFYDDGWKATVNGKELPIVKVNYVLRGLSLPAGNSSIEFRFEPSGYITGKQVLNISSVVLLLMFGGAIYFGLKNRKTGLA